MSLPRRLTAVLSGVLLLQLLLLGSGSLCAMHGRGSDAMAGMMSMTGGGATHHRTATPDRSGTTGDRASGADDQGTGGACHSPWAPRTCVSMASCLVVVAAVPSRALATVAVAASRLDVLAPAGARAGPTFAPELPPPRG